MTRVCSRLFLAGLAAAAIAAPACLASQQGIAADKPGHSSDVGEDHLRSLSPALWPEAELQSYLELEATAFPGNPEAVGTGGAVTGSFHPLAQRIGLEALRQGGSSVDAAMATAMAQITLGGGAVVSFFGIMTMVHYDAASGEISYLNAGWNTVANEDDPLSIPGEIGGYGDALYGSGEPSGRTALVGGFMRGVEAAVERFGRLPLETLMEPSIYLAEEGFPYHAGLAAYVEPRKKDLSRLPESRAVFSDAEGEWLEVGETFRQPALARTLRAVQRQGVDYLYTGPWAERLVTAVQADGGRMTLDDLAAYKVTWGEPVSTEYRGYTVYGNGLPAYGGVNMLEALNLGEAAEIVELGHWSENPESFRRVSELLNAGNIPFLRALSPDALATQFPKINFAPEARLTQAHADALWKEIAKGNGFSRWADSGPKHSDTVVAVDRRGNMTAVVHSINSAVFGKTAIIVDGITIGDPAVNQKPIVAMAGPGARLPDPTEAGLILREGKPVLAFSSMSMGLHLETFQALTNVLGFGMGPKEALDAPSILYPRMDSITDPSKMTQVVRIMEGEFSEAFMELTGLPYLFVQAEDRRYAQGLWVGVLRDPQTGSLEAASHPYTNGRALALD